MDEAQPMWMIHATEKRKTPEFVERLEFPSLANAKEWLAENWQDHVATRWVFVDSSKPEHEPRHFAEVVEGELWFRDARFR